jgi:hypothetical protein
VVDHPRGDEVHHRLLALAFALPLAVHGEQRRAEQRRPLRLGDLRPDDDVDRPGLVLERDEDRALGSLGTLPVRDQAARARQPAVRVGAQARRVSMRKAARRSRKSASGWRFSVRPRTR